MELTSRTGGSTARGWTWRSAGFVSTGPGLAGAYDGLSEIFIIATLGAFAGLLLGIMVGQLSRFVSVFASRQIGRMGWATYGAAAGAVASVLLALAGIGD